MVQLPAEGRKKRAPNWPLIPDVVLAAKRDIAKARAEEAEFDLGELRAAGKPCGALEQKLDRAREVLLILERQLAEQRKLEALLWRDLWSTPQSVQWERASWTREVAQYVRHKVLAELGDLDSAKEARQWSDRLGLTPLALLRLRWEIVADEVAEQRDSRAAAAAPAGVRERLRAVE